MSAVAFGLFVLALVAAAMVFAVRLAVRQGQSEAPPPSNPGDFVGRGREGAPRFRRADESAAEFHARRDD